MSGKPPDDSFRSLDLPQVIDTSQNDFIDEFYIPLLSRADEYKRGVGYFTTNWIKSAARGMSKLANHGGTARWVTSPILEEEDWKALQKGEQARKDGVLREQLADQISDLRFNLEYETRNTVAWMIADELLDIRFAVPSDQLSGDFHDKFGVFIDSYGNKVAFHGSQNDSDSALTNYEAYTISCDWVSEREAAGVQNHEQRFERIWDSQMKNVDTYTLTEGVAQDIAELRDHEWRPYEDPEGEGEEITLRDYQKDAVDNWRANDYSGLLAMATGTGKTFTALGALQERIQEVSGSVLVVIAVPYAHLAEQWAESIEAFDLPLPKYIFGSKNSDWKADLSRLTGDLAVGLSDVEVALTTHKTLSNEYFRNQVADTNSHTVLVGDEVHHLGSSEYQKGLLDSYTDRIGLSATPERHYDDAGTQHLVNYFDGVVYEYSLDEAIPDFLTPYEYHPIIVEMTDDEVQEYRKLSRRLARVAGAAQNDDNSQEIFERLAQKRARILKSSRNKLATLPRILDRIGEPDHLLVYTNPQQIDSVQKCLNEEGLIQHKFTYKEDDEKRQQLLKGFDRGDYDALVAMKCLDEGVDVPSTRQAILMSNSGNPMQFIQRRGRVLRKHPGKDYATIYDLIVVPSRDPPPDVVEAERGILIKELRRFEEFASSAKNEFEARNKLDPLKIEYQITDEDLEYADA